MTDVAMTVPGGFDDKPLPKRVGSRGLLPTTWLGRELRLEYTGADDKAQNTKGVLLDWCPFGVVLNVAGARTIFSWERIALVELIGD